MAQLTITIHGSTDGSPTITPVDGNGAATGQATVFEAGLTSGGDSSETTTGSINVTAPDGMASVSLGGTTFTVAELAGFSVGSPSVTIDTGEGLLTITGFTITSGPADAPTAGTLTYSYTLKAAQTQTGLTETTDSIPLVVTDATSSHATSTGTLSVRIVNDTPTANADTNSVNEDSGTPATGNVFTGGAGDVADRIGADVPTHPVTAVAFGSSVGSIGSALDGAYGSLTLNADGSYSYDLDNSNIAVNALRTGETLTEVFNYTITDKDGDTSTAQLIITINGVNDNPVAVTDSYSMPVNTPSIILEPLNADSDVEGGTLTITRINGIPLTPGVAQTIAVSHGTVTIDASGVIRFSPAANFHGNTSFSYEISDGNGGTATANQVISVNSPPQAIDNSNNGQQGVPQTGDLLSNDSDPDGDNLVISEYTIDGISGVFSPGETVTIPGVGNLIITADGQFTFMPDSGFSGSVPQISYTISDGYGGFSTANLELNVKANDSVAPDNLWNAGKSFIEPIRYPELIKVDMEMPPILSVIEAVNDAGDLNSTTSFGEKRPQSLLQEIKRIGNIQFFGDRLQGMLGKFALNHAKQVDRPISQEIDRIEHQVTYDDLMQRTQDHGGSGWGLGSLRHSITMRPNELTGDEEYLTVHTTLTGALLYVEIEHTVLQQPRYDVVKFSASQIDGRPLPKWLSFDPQSGVLTGVAPAGGELLKLQISAEFADGRVYTSQVVIEPDSARIVELHKMPQNTKVLDTFAKQLTQSANAFDVEVDRFRNVLKP
jgi:VCBS repeat-containing protein